MNLRSQNNNLICLDGNILDDQTRCVHYHTDLDIIALKFKCCNTYYPCYQCHDQVTDHEVEKFDITKNDHELVVLCGGCKTELTFEEYSRNDPISCINCSRRFNSGCKDHYELYFEM